MNEAIIILGMHRSGTSCLIGCLKDYGVNLGSVSKSNKHNRKGNQENKEVFQLNESLLNFNNGSWRRPPEGKLIWDAELEFRRNKVLADYEKMIKPWGIKDPRMVLTYSFWKENLPNHLLVGTFRHPLAVNQSLLARKHKNLSMSKEQAFYLWQTYNLKLLDLHSSLSFPIINFDLAHAEYLEKIDLVRVKLGLGGENEGRFFDKSLINQNNFSRKDCPPKLLPLYDKLLEICV